MDWAAFLKEYGLPITMLAGFIYLVITGKFVPGKTHDDVKLQRDRALNEVYRWADREDMKVGEKSGGSHRGSQSTAHKEDREGR